MPEASPELPQQEPLSCSILRSIKEAQSQHGLRHSDWARYRCRSAPCLRLSISKERLDRPAWRFRRYCSKRLRGTRRMAGLSRRGRYHKKPLEARAMKSDRYGEDFGRPLLDSRHQRVNLMIWSSCLPLDVADDGGMPHTMGFPDAETKIVLHALNFKPWASQTWTCSCSMLMQSTN